METIDITVMLDAGEGWPCAAVVRFEVGGVVGVRAVDADNTPVWLLAGINSADGLLRAGLPLDRLDVLSPVWSGTAVLPVLRALAEAQAEKGEMARDAILLRRYPRVKDAAARLRLYQGAQINLARVRLAALRAEWQLDGARGRRGAA